MSHVRLEHNWCLSQFIGLGGCPCLVRIAVPFSCSDDGLNGAVWDIFLTYCSLIFSLTFLLLSLVFVNFRPLENSCIYNAINRPVGCLLTSLFRLIRIKEIGLNYPLYWKHFKTTYLFSTSNTPALDDWLWTLLVYHIVPQTLTSICSFIRNFVAAKSWRKNGISLWIFLFSLAFPHRWSGATASAALQNRVSAPK